jgi:V8-like Glu-specific endopeptidase
MNTDPHENLKRLLAEAYQLKMELERAILVAGGPVERARLKRQLETCNADINRYKTDLATAKAASSIPDPKSAPTTEQQATQEKTTSAAPAKTTGNLEQLRSSTAINGNYGDAWDAERFAQYSQAVCLVEAPNFGGELGTGFLVAPRLILTNYHVVSAVGAKGSLAQKAKKLAFRFGYRGSGTAVKLGQLIKVDQNQPLLVSSTLAKLDYALLQLEQPACDENDNALVPLKIVPDRLLQENDTVWIVQHPMGGTLRFAQGQISRVDLQRKRFEYNTNTEPGSSGSPVFDCYWNLVGLHHSGAPNPPRPGTDKGNEGILLSAIWPKIQALVKEANAPAQTSVTDPTQLPVATVTDQESKIGKTDVTSVNLDELDLSPADLLELSNYLLKCDAMSDPRKRRQVLNLVSQEVFSHLNQDGELGVLVLEIVQTCEKRLWLGKLLEAVRTIEGDTKARRKLDTYIGQLNRGN